MNESAPRPLKAGESSADLFVEGRSNAKSYCAVVAEGTLTPNATAALQKAAIVQVADAIAHCEAVGPGGAPPDIAFLETVSLTTRLPEWEALAR